MHSIIDLQCSPDKIFVEVALNGSIRTTEAMESLERALIGQGVGRLFPTQKGFLYYLPDEAWDEDRIVQRLHGLLKEVFGDDHTVSFVRGNKRIMREADGNEYVVAASA